MAEDLDVLVVDDDPDTRETMAILLGQFGYRVRTAKDAAAALAELEREPAPCVLLDLGMPGMDGIELARTLRARLGDSLVLIALTGWANTERQDEAERAGVDFVLAKPLDLDRLRRVLPPLTPQASLPPTSPKAKPSLMLLP